MAGDGIKFVVDLENRNSGTPADQELDKAEKAAKKAHHSISAFSSDLFKAEVRAHYFEKVMDGAIERVKEGFEAVRDTIRETLNEAAGERRQSMAMTNLLGGKEDAEKALDYMDRFSELSEFGEEKTKAWGMELLNSGYRGREWKDAMAAMVDAASMAPDKMAGAEEAMTSLSRIKMTGKIDARALRGLRLNVKDVMGDMADALGMSPKAVKKALEEGAIPAARAYEAVLTALERKTGKRLGEAGLTAGKGLDAKLTHWREFPQKIMMAVKDSPGIDKIEHALDHLLDAFDPNGPKGSKMVEGLGSLMNTVGQFMEDTDWASVAKSIGGVASSLGGWVDPLSKIAGLLLSVTESIAKLPDIGGGAGESLAEALIPELNDQEIPASHAFLAKEIATESGSAWGAQEHDYGPLKSAFAESDKFLKEAVAEQAASDIREAEMNALVESTNLAEMKAAMNAVGGWGLQSLGAPMKPEAKAIVTVHVSGGTGSPKEVGEAVKTGAEEGMTKALEKAAQQRGTASGRRRR
jgi:tape measure domain-containing protein